MKTISVGLIGDFDLSVPAHQGIPRALALAAEAQGLSLEVQWLPTQDVCDEGALGHFDGLWCVPASPYRSMDGALRAIGFARRQGIPFLGTCGGFQHAVVEYARHVLGWANADHAETSPATELPVIALLRCALVEVSETVRLRPGSRLADAYGIEEIVEGYHCRYGLNPAFRAALVSEGQLRVAAEDARGEVRALELEGHPFFVLTLFQPERAALAGRLPPPVAVFTKAVAAHAGASHTP
jgi:CTP synthase (UTP-ammonia lyase)